ncbi:nuclease [Luteimonas sp. SX5]|uniref:Nuclease n=1 Tax=Luteimonas galliterrae TaxID=2940486 RepID=A0ABT0MIJ1_9GAMM|nr:Calx-beta domain-containing protein [Luteimonas galliterrae]MCL1634687.1 nuclease [Luteimonas galliterrae]
MNGFSRRMALALVLSCGLSAAHAQCIDINAVDAAQTQNFDALASSGTGNALSLPGWQLLEAGGGGRDNELYAADTGGSNTGDTYSYGASGAAERALGTLRSGTLIPTFGACFTNNTGAAIEALDVAYRGEQWRLGTASRSDRIDFQYSLDATDLATGSWTDVDTLDFATPNTATTGAKDGNDPANQAALAANIGSLSIANGATFWVRWNDSDASGADDGLSVDDFSLTARGEGGGGVPTLNVGDASQAEGDAGTTQFTFFVTLSAPAPAGGVAFDIATADGTATAGDDYVGASLTAQAIPEGSTSYAFTVTVNGDTTTEPDETFAVNVGNIVGANSGDAQGIGTIVNDDISLVAIHDIQGAGASSPLAGQQVNTSGIVTGRKNNGFFLQAADDETDANPATSEGVFVFTSSAPPATAAIGARVRVSGTVVEFVPAADPGQPPLTEIGSVTNIAQLSAGHALPAAVALTPALPSPEGPIDQLERLEGMRVTVASLTVAAPTGGFTDEPNATGSSNGVFHGVVTGTPRPFREPGIEAPNPAPSGSSIPPLPRWDANPELIAIDSDAIGAAKLDVSTGTMIAGLTGPLDYGFRRYTLLPEATAPVAAAAPSAARLPTDDEFTIAAYNLERFFDTVNDPSTGEPVLTAAAFAKRLNKASLAIRNYLNTPDIVAIVEIENYGTLQALADKINADAVAAGQPDPAYEAYLFEGNDVGGIDVGFLTKNANVPPDAERVEVLGVTQHGKDTTWIDPSTGAPSLLNDRPPLQLDAVVHYGDGREFPVSVIAVHQRSLNDSDSEEPAGPTTLGDRVRQKRQKQAEYLAGVVQDMQTADPDRRIVVLGDFNAFDFNDGLGDSMNVVTGTPTPDEQTAVPGDGVDLVNPDLLNLFSLEPADQRYSFVFGGNAQSLDHVLANQTLLLATDGYALDHARINADFPEINRNDADSPSRLADHDPAIAYFKAPPVSFADLSATASATPGDVDAGAVMTFDAGIANAGPSAAAFPAIGFAFDAALPDLAVVAPNDWSCDAPVIETAQTSLACSAQTLAASDSASFQLTAVAPADRVGGTVQMAAQAASQTEDPDTGNNGATAVVAVLSQVDLGVALNTASSSTRPGGTVNFQIPVVSKGLAAAAQAKLVVRANLPPRNGLLQAPAGWQCVRDNAAATYEAQCTRTAAMPVGRTENFRLTAIVTPRNAPASLDVEAEASSAVPDRTPADNIAVKSIPVN